MIEFRLVNYDGVVLEQTISKMVCKTPEGMITILPRHINLVTPLPKQTIFFDNQSYQIESGLLQLINDKLVIIVCPQEMKKDDKDLSSLINKLKK